MKAFSEQERELIRVKLLESCNECWSKYGYRRTNIRELCAMTGISTGAFYMFFSSKEHLFFEAAHFAKNKITRFVNQTLPANPTKYDFAKTIKALYKERQQDERYLNFDAELNLIVRKLSPGIAKEIIIKHTLDWADIIEIYGLVPKVDVRQIVTSFSILGMSVLHQKIFENTFNDSFDYMIDTLVEAMFE